MMTKEEWERQQKIVRRIVDPQTGRTRFSYHDMHVLVCLCVFSLSLSVYLYICLSVFVCLLSVCLLVCVCMYLSLPVCLLVCLSVCMYVCI